MPQPVGLEPGGPAAEGPCLLWMMRAGRTPLALLFVWRDACATAMLPSSKQVASSTKTAPGGAGRGNWGGRSPSAVSKCRERDGMATKGQGGNDCVLKFSGRLYIILRGNTAARWGDDTRFASSQWYLLSVISPGACVARRFAGKSSNSNITKPFIRKLESSRPVVSLNLCERCYRRGR